MWCHVPGTDSPSAQAAEALIWASCLRSPDSTPDASSNGKITHGRPSSPPSAPGTSLPPRSGMTSPPSTDGLYGARSILSSPGIPVSHSPKQDSAREPTTSGTCGPMSPASSGKSNQNGCSSKTSRGTSPSALKPCCESYGTWAGRLRLAYSRRLKLARRMNGSAGSAWPTARASENENRTLTSAPSHGKTHGAVLAGVAGDMMASWPTSMAGTPAQNGNSAAGNSDFSRKAEELARTMWFTPNTPNGGRTLQAGTSPTGMTPDGIKRQVGLENQTRLWLTPRASDTGQGEKPETFLPRMGDRSDACHSSLAAQSLSWGTPRASDAEKGGPNMAFGAGGTPLPAQAAQWPTPTAQNVKGSSPDSVTRADGKSRMDILHYRAEQGFSRPDQETPRHGPTLSQLRRIWRPLRASLIASHGRATWRRLWKGRTKRRLNPGFVEWLMGWPPGHALCDCSATEFARFQRHMRGALSALPMASGQWVWRPPRETLTPVQTEMLGI